MKGQKNAKQSPDGRVRKPATRIISTNLDLKKSGLVTDTASLRRPIPIGGPQRSPRTPGSPDERQAEVLRRLREQEESRRRRYVEMLRQDEEKRKHIEARKEELKRLMKARALEKEAEAKEKRLSAIRVSQAKFDSMVERLEAKESRRLQHLDETQTQASKEQEQDAERLAAVVQNIERRGRSNRDVQKAKAKAQRQRKRDAEERQKATQALWDRQQRILQAIQDRNRAQLERLLSVQQPHLTARMPRYNFMEYPANSTMRRLLHEYKRKRIDEVTFNEQAVELARKMSPRRILLHQNQLLRDQLALERAAEGRGGPSLTFVSARPVSERTPMRWHEPSPPADVRGRFAEALVDEALRRAGGIYRHLLERSDIDLSTLLDADDETRPFDDDGDLELSPSAFDFGDEQLEVDAAAVERIDAMYRSQACTARSERETRAYPSGELGTFSSAVLDPGVSCSCTTLSGIDSQCSLCQLAVATGAGKT